VSTVLATRATRATYLDQRLGDLEEVLLSLRDGTLARPVENRLIAYTVRVVQDLVQREALAIRRERRNNEPRITYLDQLRERLHHSGLVVTVNLNGVEQADFRFGAVAEGFQKTSKGLQEMLSLAVQEMET
jgi:hypothetical protein